MSLVGAICVAVLVAATIWAFVDMWRNRRDMHAPPSPPSAITGVDLQGQRRQQELLGSSQTKTEQTQEPPNQRPH
jgi:hypothetical protein